jgi:hypothetical protein
MSSSCDVYCVLACCINFTLLTSFHKSNLQISSLFILSHTTYGVSAKYEELCQAFDKLWLSPLNSGGQQNAPPSENVQRIWVALWIEIETKQVDTRWRLYFTCWYAHCVPIRRFSVSLYWGNNVKHICLVLFQRHRSNNRPTCVQKFS